MKFDFTEKQLNAVDSTGVSLVSAAAGSGKTRVLTTKIVKLIENGADIREMMIATFTQAAACEMKARIAMALLEHSGSARIRKQAEYVGIARIGTYHNFCVHILRDNYSAANLPYGFVVMDAMLAATMKHNVAMELVSDLLEKKDAGTVDYMARYTTRFNKKAVADHIISVYDYMSKLVDPDCWLELCESRGIDTYYETEPDAATAEISYENSMPYVRTLVNIVRQFRERYSEVKNERSLVDFDDLLRKTHTVLKGKNIKYKYVFVDEYQDTNPLQDSIISMISENEVFMVGDKKQSIYRFNYADPSIFIEKERAFKEKGLYVMNENFRSSSAVINAVNYIMEKCMTSDLGAIDYSDDERLVCRNGGSGEVFLMAEPSGEKRAVRAGMEAEWVADRIAALIGTEIQSGQGSKVITPGDIAVLYRSAGSSPFGIAQGIKNALASRNIPYRIYDSSSGAESRCAEFFMAVLKVINNRNIDIPLITLMKCPSVGFTDNELAEIRIEGKLNGVPHSAGFAAAVKNYVLNHENAVSLKIQDMYGIIDKLQAYSAAYSLSDFLYTAADMFSIFDYALILSEDEYRAVFTFIDTIVSCGEKSLPMVIKYMDDYRDKNGYYSRVAGTSDNRSVSIMTIHKSKGLEFPVVFVVGLDKAFNVTDYTKKCLFLFDAHEGILPVYITKENGVYKKHFTALRDRINSKMVMEDVAEELRLLYVAMTRAENCLYLTSVYSPSAGSLKLWENLASGAKSFTCARCFLDFIMGVVMAGDSESIRIVGINDRPETIALQSAEKEESEEILFDNGAGWIEFRDISFTPASASVTEIKNMMHHLDFKCELFSEKYGRSGKEFGTLIHSVLEKAVVLRDYDLTVDDMYNRKLISDEEKVLIDSFSDNIKSFLSSDICDRICRADTVLREKHFLLEKDASEYDMGTGMVLLNGVLDIAFLENDEWVIVDYKTDRTEKNGIKELQKIYSEQLKLYAEAIELSTGKKVKEKYLYFLRYDKMYSVN